MVNKNGYKLNVKTNLTIADISDIASKSGMSTDQVLVIINLYIRKLRQKGYIIIKESDI